MARGDSRDLSSLQMETLHRLSSSHSGIPYVEYTPLAYPPDQRSPISGPFCANLLTSHSTRSNPRGTQISPSGSTPSYPDFFGRTFESNIPTQYQAPRPGNSYFIDNGLLGHAPSLGTDFLYQPPQPTPTPSSSAPSFGVFPTEAEYGDYFHGERSPFKEESFLGQAPGFSNGLDRPRLDYSHRPVQGILDVPPFAQSAQSYGIAPQPTSSNVTYRAGNLFPPPSCPDPFASDTFSYCPPTSSVDLPLYQSTIHDSTFQCHLTPTTTLDPELSVLKPHNEMDAQDKVVRQAEAPRPTKIKRPRNRGTDSDEDYRPSPPKRRRELAPRLPSSSLATRSPGAVKSSSTSKRNSPNPRPRRSRTTRLAVTHPSGYHLGESASSNIHEWLRVYFTPSKAQRSLRICAFCGVSDGNLSRHVLSTLNHCVDWMLGILEETLCGSLLLDALNFVVIWAETTHGPVSAAGAAERDLLLSEYSDRSSHAVQALRFGAKPFETLCQIARRWARETDATAYRCSCGMKASLRKDVLRRHLRTSRKCRPLRH